MAKKAREPQGSSARHVVSGTQSLCASTSTLHGNYKVVQDGQDHYMHLGIAALERGCKDVSIQCFSVHRVPDKNIRSLTLEGPQFLDSTPQSVAVWQPLPCVRNPLSTKMNCTSPVIAIVLVFRAILTALAARLDCQRESMVDHSMSSPQDQINVIKLAICAHLRFLFPALFYVGHVT